MSSVSGEVTNVWPIAGPPDVTFFNPASGLVHVAIGEPGLVESIDPRTGHGTRTVSEPPREQGCDTCADEQMDADDDRETQA